jgi:small subunit ribosomal protein S17
MTNQADTKVVKARQFVGEVVAMHEAKTLRVLVKSPKLHAKYRKTFTESKKYPVHDEKGVAKVGDQVSFVECRPLSKTKRWRLLQVLKKA